MEERIDAAAPARRRELPALSRYAKRLRQCCANAPAAVQTPAPQRQMLRQTREILENRAKVIDCDYNGIMTAKVISEPVLWCASEDYIDRNIAHRPYACASP